MSKVRAAATIVLAASFISVGWLQPSVTTRHSACVDSASVPMDVRDNRVFVPLRITGPQGKSRNAVFWVDTGGDTLVISGRLAHELGLRPVGKPVEGMGATLAHLDSKPQLFIRGMKIDLTGVRVDVSLSGSQRTAFPGVASEGFLPATVLRHYDVVFDYPAHRFTISQPGKIVHQGQPLPVFVSPSTGFVRLTATVAGRPYGFMLDTGAAYTGLSRTLMDQWAAQHPLWPRSIGAVGAANMVGKKFDVENALMRIPKMTLASIPLLNVGMVSRPAGVYERTVSGDIGSPVVGAIAGNVLRHFRVEVDYAAGIAYFEFHGSDDATDLNCLGLVVQIKQNNTVLVSGVAKRAGKPEVPDVRPGDILLQVDDHKLTGASLAEVLEYLSGSPGEVKRLTVRRGSKELTVLATVLPHPQPGTTLESASGVR